jgi:type IV secretion system protein VirD4
MGSARQVFLSLLILTVFILAGMICATQYIAAGLSYHPHLGAPFLRMADMAIYPPWMFWVWSLGIGAKGGAVFDTAWVIQMGGLLGGVLAVFFLKKLFGDGKLTVKPFGEEAWGTLQDAKKAGLIGNKDGVVLGRIGGEILKHNGPEHILVTGATRSGKGVGIVVPTLWNWQGSAIVYDPKEELWELSAGYRSRKGPVAFYNPLSPDTVRFNPLLSVRKGISEVGDVQNIVQFLSNPNATQQQRNIWEESGKRLVAAVILHVLYAEEDEHKNLAVVREKILDLDKTLKEMMRTPHRLGEDGKPEVHPEVLRVAKALYTKYKKFRESVAGTAETYLELWADELIARSTSTNDFDVLDFMHGEKPFTLYVQIPYSDGERLSALLRFTLSQMTRRLLRDIKGRQAQDNKHRVLLCLEEFPSIGKVDFLERDLGMVAGYGLKALLVCQSANTIHKEYGQNSTIFDNCHIQVAFASSDPATQKRMSQMAGQTTEIRESRNLQKDKFGRSRGSTTSYSESTRAILDEGQARELDETKQLIFVGSTKPLKTDKLRYYDYAHLNDYAAMKPPKNDQLTGKAPQHDWSGERAKGKLLPMPEINVERETGEELQDDLVIRSEKMTLHDIIHDARKKEQREQVSGGDMIALEEEGD